MLAVHLGQHAPRVFIPHHGHILGIWDAEGFVMIAGFLMGAIISRKKLDQNPSKLWALVRERVVKIYTHQLYAALPITLAAMAGAFWLGVERFGVGPPLQELSLVFLMLQGPSHTEILILYVGVFALIPLFVGLIRWRGVGAALCASLALYLLGQLTYGMFLVDLIHRYTPLVVQMPYFDVLAWQFCFMVGFALAWRLEHVKAFLHAIGAVTVTALIAAFALAIVVVNENAYALAMWWRDSFAITGAGGTYDPRQDFAASYLFVTLLLTGIVTCLALGPLPAFLRVARRAGAWFFSLPFFVALGRDSIRMYVLHVYLAFIFVAALRLELVPPIPLLRAFYICLLGAVFLAAPYVFKWIDRFTGPGGYRRPKPRRDAQGVRI